MTKYLVCIKDKEDGLLLQTICDTTNDLSLLTAHLDEEKYEIVSVNAVVEIKDYKEFCKKDNTLESGNK